MATTVPQFLLPKANSLLRLQHITSYFRRQQRCKACRYAPTTTSSSTKPRVLEKPAKFNPPSHPARRNRFARRYAGPPLSQADLEAQKTKQYPQTMPPEGSFMHWFLTNRSIHLWITLGTLTTLAISTFIINFHHTSPYAHLLPPVRQFFISPLSFLTQCLEVYKMHTLHISAETAERRKKRVEDAQKRQQFKKAHGLGEAGGGWFGAGDAVAGKVVDDASPVPDGGTSGAALTADAVGLRNVGLRGDDGEGYVDFEGKRRRVKKWLGIW